MKKLLVPVARLFYVLIFLLSAPKHFASQTIDYAASHGVPVADILVPLSGVLALVGALSVLFGFRAKKGAWLLVLFLVPVTLTMHNFWTIADPMSRQIQEILFLKNVSMLGAALLITVLGSGPFSIDSGK